MTEYIETHDQKEFLPEQRVPAVFLGFLKNLFSAMGYDVRIETFENHKDFTISIKATWDRRVDNV